MPQAPQSFDALDPGRYEIPRLLHMERVLLEGTEQPRLRLVLEGGYELDMPVTPVAMELLVRGLGNFLRPARRSQP